MLDLQVAYVAYDEAALTFSGARALTVDEVARAVVDKVLPHRPMEVAFPPSRAAAARLANAAPEVARLLRPALTRRGRRSQERIKAAKGGGS
jgi:hypothetical protein